MYYRPDSLLAMWRPMALNIHPAFIRCGYLPSSSSSRRVVCPHYTYKVRDNCAHFEIEVPGVEKCDISVETRGRKLDIRAKRYKCDATDDEKKKVYVEYRFVAELGPKADINNIKADYRGLGVLKLFVPLKGEEVRKIEVDS